jgi:hypothetical protein
VSDTAATTGDGLHDSLQSVREGPAADWYGAATFVIAVALGAVHPAGLVAGGALVGLTAPSVTRALLLGCYVGTTVLLLFWGYLFAVGAPGAYFAGGRVMLLDVAIALGLPTLGAGLRGLG